MCGWSKPWGWLRSRRERVWARERGLSSEPWDPPFRCQEVEKNPVGETGGVASEDAVIPGEDK